MHLEDAPLNERMALLPRDVKLENEERVPLLLLFEWSLLLPLLLRLDSFNEEPFDDATCPSPRLLAAACWLPTSLSSPEEVRKVRERAFMVEQDSRAP
jgi:hypothetical protein